MSTSDRPRVSLPFAISVGVLVTLATRLPQLFGPHLLPDGDEAIVLLMAKHLLEGEPPTLFFYGQSYGLALPETGAAALVFALAGVSTAALKVAMLVLWSAGLVLFPLAVRRLAGERAAVLAAFLLPFCPAWGAWSMKARGGYVTGFLFTNLALWMIGALVREARPRPARAAGLGATCAVVALCQPLWVNALGPFVLWYLVPRWRQSDAAAFVGGGLLTAAAVLVPGTLQASGSWAPSLVNTADLLGAVLESPLRLVEAMSGAFYLQEAAGGPLFTTTGWLWAIATAWAVLSTLRRVAARAAPPASVCALVAIGLVFLFAIPTATPRYLLPIPGLAILLLATETAERTRVGGPGAARRRVVSAAAGLVLAASGTAAMVALRDLPLAGRVRPQVASERRALAQLVATLEARGVAHVYCDHHLLQWMLVAGSGERILARWQLAVDRVPRYARAVDRARAEGRPVALVAYHSQRVRIDALLGPRQPPPLEVEGRYVVYFDPTEGELERLGFELGTLGP